MELSFGGERSERLKAGRFWGFGVSRFQGAFVVVVHREKLLTVACDLIPESVFSGM